MATKVNYTLSEPEKFEISSIDDIDKVLKENDIIPEYGRHLKQVNTCILMFEELETKRTWGEVISDWADGERSKVINKDLIERLKKLKEEILKGIRYYMRLLNKADDLKTILHKIPVSKFSLDVKSKDDHIDQAAKVEKYAVQGAVQGAKVGAGVGAVTVASCIAGAIAVKLGIVATTVAAFPLVVAGAGVAGCAVAGGVIVGGAMGAIYAIAKQCGEKRGLKYQQIKNLNDALDAHFFADIKSNHEFLKQIYDEIDEHLKRREFKLEVMGHVYSDIKNTSYKELKNEEDMDDKTCEMVAKRDAKKESKNFLIHHFESSAKDAKEIIDIIEQK